jgi:hypothetical protein
MEFKLTLYITLPDASGIDVDFEIEAYPWVQEAKLYGPPEDCYPADSDSVIDDIRVLTPVDGFADADIARLAVEQHYDDIEEAVFEAADLRRYANC